MAPFARPFAALLVLHFAASSAAAVTEPSASDLALRGELKPPARRYSDVWGFGDYLLLGTFQADSASQHGLYVIDASDPDSLRLAGHLRTDAPPLDVTGADTLALLAFEPGFTPPRPAVILASVADPAAPYVLGTFRSDSVSQVHTAWLDPPYAYLSSRSTGDLRIIDFTNPSSPLEVGSWSTGSAGRFLHDLIVVDTLAYLAYWEDGFRILSVADPARPYELGRYDYPGAFSHSVEVSEDGRTAYVTDEIFSAPYGGLRVLDVSDPSDIREVGAWECPGSDASIHNLFRLGDLLYVSYYMCGVRILDISDPRAPVEIAHADVDGASGGLTGFWGVYPAVRGADTLVYASHMDRGALVFEPRAFRALTVAVDGSGEFASIQSAVDAAGAGDTVRVAAGVYHESVAMEARVVLEGAGSGVTIIDPSLAGRGIALRGGGPETLIRWLAVTGGVAADTLGGGGILLEGSGALVESVAVFGCAAQAAGGGVRVIGGAPTLRALRVFSNRAPEGGGIAFLSPSVSSFGPLLVDCELTDNAADGAGGGLAARGEGPISLVRCACARNVAPRGGGIAAFDSPDLRVENSRVAWNRADLSGGGLYGEDSFFALDNSILADNAAPDGSALGGMGVFGVFAAFRDAVVSGNRGASTLSADGGSDVQFDACDAFGNEGALVAGALSPPDPSRGNIFADPLFVGPTWERLDYLPRAGSPLIDAGFPSPKEDDLDGTRQDIGLGGGPGSGWVAPRAMAGLRAVPDDNYDVLVLWDVDYGGSGALPVWHALYRDATAPVPLDAGHRLGRIDASQSSWFLDGSPSPADTLLFYRVVPEDSLGHAGSPSDTFSVRPSNRPPRLSLSTRSVSPPELAVDSLRIELYAAESLFDPVLLVNGDPFVLTSQGVPSAWFAEVPVPASGLSIVAAAADTFGAAVAETLSGNLVRLGPGFEDVGADSTGAFRFGPIDLDEPALLLVSGGPPPAPFPRADVPISPAYSILDLARSFYFADSLAVTIRSPERYEPGEAITFANPFAPAFPVSRELGGSARTARISYRSSPIVLVRRPGGMPAPDAVRISFAEPNPFRERTLFRLDLDRAAPVALEIFDASGRSVRQLFRGSLFAGRFSIEWDGRDDGGNTLPSGHYFLREAAGDRVLSRHVILLR